MAAKKKKKRKKLTFVTFLCVIALSNKTVAHTFLASFENANGLLHQQRLLRSRHFATMVV